jgi:HTH-type transcriptional regulator/antitoxin HigA
MNIKPLHTKTDYRNALQKVERLWDAPEGSPEAEQLEVWVLLIQDYESRHYPVPDPNPIAFLEHVMEARGLTRKDLEPFIGTRARVAEVLNRQRALTLEMIRRLSAGLKLPADVLVRPYRLRHRAA